MEGITISLVLYGIIINSGTVAGDETAVRIQKGPGNVVNQVGETVQFSCQIQTSAEASGALMWKVNTPNRASDDTIGFYVLSTNVVKMNLDDTKYNISSDGETLTVYDIQLEDGGNYICEVQPGNSKGIASLLVLEQPTALASPEVIPGENCTEYECQVNFGSPRKEQIPLEMVPKLHSFISGYQLAPNKPDVTYGSPSTMRQTYMVSVEPDTTALFHNLTCEVRVEEPEFMLTHSASTLVAVPVSAYNLTFEPERDMFLVGEVLTCVARGNPAPQITWVAKDSLIRRQGPKLPITSGMANTWTCIAKNTVKGEVIEIQEDVTFKVESKTVPPTKSAKSLSTAVIAVIVVVVLLVVVGVVVAIVVITRKRSSRPGYSAGKVQPPQGDDVTSAPAQAQYGKVVNEMQDKHDEDEDEIVTKNGEVKYKPTPAPR